MPKIRGKYFPQPSHINVPMNIRYVFHQITTFIKVHVTFVFGLQSSDPLIERFYSKIYQLKGLNSEAQKQRPHELLWMLWFDEKLYI